MLGGYYAMQITDLESMSETDSSPSLLAARGRTNTIAPSTNTSR